jgi:DNA-binding Xre family transcriptional regulator
MRRKKRSAITLKPGSIVLNVAPLFAARQIAHPYTFLLKIGIGNNTTNNILNHKSTSINLQHLTLLCTALECTPNDLLAVPKQNLAPNHPLQKLADVQDTLTNEQMAQWLKTKSVEEVRKMMEE